MERRRTRLGRESKEKRWSAFFFRNFPAWCTVEDLQRRFEIVGRVEDVFVPVKKDKVGSRFGFVRFRGKGDEDKILRGLNNMIGFLEVRNIGATRRRVPGREMW